MSQEHLVDPTALVEQVDDDVVANFQRQLREGGLSFVDEPSTPSTASTAPKPPLRTETETDPQATIVSTPENVLTVAPRQRSREMFLGKVGVACLPFLAIFAAAPNKNDRAPEVEMQSLRARIALAMAPLNPNKIDALKLAEPVVTGNFSAYVEQPYHAKLHHDYRNEGRVGPLREREHAAHATAHGTIPMLAEPGFVERFDVIEVGKHHLKRLRAVINSGKISITPTIQPVINAATKVPDATLQEALLKATHATASHAMGSLTVADSLARAAAINSCAQSPASVDALSQPLRQGITSYITRIAKHSLNTYTATVLRDLLPLHIAYSHDRKPAFASEVVPTKSQFASSLRPRPDTVQIELSGTCDQQTNSQ